LELAATITGLMPVQVLPPQRIPDDPNARSKKNVYTYKSMVFFFSRLYNPSGFRPAQLSLSILSRKVLQTAIASGTSNPQLGGEPGI
jgi:hypothetical protein